MAKRKIVLEGDPVLRKTSKEVAEVTPRICALLDDMLETMRASNGVGLAAVQVGILKRIVVIEVDDRVYEMINPVITKVEGEETDMEGCLSVPGRWAMVSRPYRATVKYTDRSGKQKTLTGEGLLARAICHETDHLDGKLFVDNVVRYLTDAELKELQG